MKSQGDGFMLAFPSARRAVECATTIQREVATVDECLRVRMGSHTGEPVRQADDFYGRDVAFAAAREVELKGFDGPQTVFAVDW